MELTNEQKQKITEWVDEGLGLSEIQKRINNEFKIPMSFMDVRLLVIDLGAEYQEPEPEEKPDESSEDNQSNDSGNKNEAVSDEPTDVSVEIDTITRPGALISGSVIFSDGIKAMWYLDQTGRIALDAGQPGYKPTEQDLQVFQLKLREALQQKGF